MPPVYRFDIETLLVESQPRSILIIGNPPVQQCTDEYVQQSAFLNRHCDVNVIEPDGALQALEGHPRYDLGIVVNAVEYLSKSEAGQLIARLRDVYTARFCVVVRIGDRWPGLASNWKRADFFAFGMSLVNRYQTEDGDLHLYKYDIASYKKTPEWLNSKDWANPHLWDKYRW